MFAAAKLALKKLILPHPSKKDHTCKPGPVVVAGLFRTASGIGQSARTCYEGLKERDVDVLAVDLSDAFNQLDLEDPGYLSSMPSSHSGTLILHVNWPEIIPALFHLGLRRWQTWRIIGYWAWELSTPPANWKKAARHISEIWTPSDFVTNVFAGQGIRVKTVPHRIHVPDDLMPIDDNTDNKVQTALTCLVLADGRSSFERKNVDAAIEIFHSAFKDNQQARLILKTRNIKEFPELYAKMTNIVRSDARIELLDGTLDQRKLWQLLNRVDVVISAHRSEGFGLPLAEAMALGKVVLATAYSGNLAFMTQNNALLIPYTMTSVEDGFGVYNGVENGQWAQIDVVTASRRLEALSGDKHQIYEIGAQAKVDIAAQLNGSEYFLALGDQRRHFDGN